MGAKAFQTFVECMPIILAILLEFIPFPSDQKIKDSTDSLAEEVELPKHHRQLVENLGNGIASATSIAPTLVAAMATVVTFKENGLTVVMFFALSVCVIVYSRYLGRSLHRLTDRVPVPKFVSRFDPEKIHYGFNWAALISRLNLTIDFVLLALVIYHNMGKHD